MPINRSIANTARFGCERSMIAPFDKTTSPSTLRTAAKRVGMIGDPLAKRARRRSHDVRYGGRHVRGEADCRTPRAKQHLRDRTWHTTGDLAPKLFGRQLMEVDSPPDNAGNSAHLFGLTERLRAREDVVPSCVSVLVQRTRSHGR